MPFNSLNKRVYLKCRPGADGSPSPSNFGCETFAYPTLESKECIIVQTLYLSVDPYMRCRMNCDSGVEYAEAWQLGDTITGPGVGVVIESNLAHLNEGDFVTSTGLEWPWQTYANLKKGDVKKVSDMKEEELPLLLSIFGVSGITAVLGVLLKGNISPRAQQVMVVSAAAGGCGSVAGQVGKLLGASKVVGICGTEEKCRFLLDDLGFDGAICYKEQDVAGQLTILCPNGIDVYFDNVGGSISDTVISQMNQDSSIILCGQISKYNEDVPYPPPLSYQAAEILETRKIIRERFLVLNHQEKMKEGTQFLQKEYAAGRIKSKETVAHGLENAGCAFVSMMCGHNIGKQIVKL